MLFRNKPLPLLEIKIDSFEKPSAIEAADAKTERAKINKVVLYEHEEISKRCDQIDEQLAILKGLLQDADFDLLNNTITKWVSRETALDDVISLLTKMAKKQEKETVNELMKLGSQAKELEEHYQDVYQLLVYRRGFG